MNLFIDTYIICTQYIAFVHLHGSGWILLVLGHYNYNQMHVCSYIDQVGNYN